MLASRIALRMEDENPPDTSVPKPTCAGKGVTTVLGGFMEKTDEYLDPLIQVISNRSDAASQIKVTSGAMTYACRSLLDYLHFRVVKVHGMA